MKKLVKTGIFLFALLYFNINSFAQTGPGGVGGSNLILWLNADSVAATNGSPVDEWADISSQNNDAVQNDGTNQPILRVGQVNSHNVVEFDGVNDFLNLNNNITTDGVSIYLVLDNASASGVSTYAITTQDHEFLSRIVGGSADGRTGLSYGSSMYPTPDSVVSKLEMISGQTAATNTSILTSIRGKDSLYTNAPSSFNSNSNSVIGAFNNGTATSNFHNGNIAEVIVYNDTLNPLQRNILMNTITAKYGSDMINLSEDHYDYQNNFSHDIIAIGQMGSYTQTEAKGHGVLEITNPNNLSDGEYFFTGHNNLSLDTNTVDVPNGFESRLDRVWRADLTGDPGSVDLRFYVDANSSSNLALTQVMIDDDGDFSNGGTSLHDFGRTVDANGAFVSFSDVPIHDSAYFTLGTFDSDNIIRSNQSGDWDIASTWDCNCVPSINSIVLVIDTDVVNMNTVQNVNSLTIMPNATLNLNANSVLHLYDTLNIYGSLNNDGSMITIEGNKDIAFYNYRSDAQTNPVSFYSLEINNPQGLFLDNSLWHLQNSIQINSGQLVNSGTFVFLSDSGLTAQIQTSIPNSFSGGGEYVMQRYISPRRAEFTNIASPTGTTLDDWDQEIYMSGVGGNDGNAQYGPGGTIYYSVFEFHNLTQSHDSMTSINEQLQPGHGYELFLGDDLVEYTPTELGTVDVHGVPTSGDVTVDVNTGDNLLGNPYQAFVDWSLVSKPGGMSSVYYVFNASSGNYEDYTGLIPPAQAFWVDLPSGGPSTVTFSEGSKVYNNSSNTSIFYRHKKSDIDSLVLSLTNNQNPYSHSHVIEIDPNFDPKFKKDYRTYRKSRLKEVPALFSSRYIESYGKEQNLIVTPIADTKSNYSIPLNFTAGVAAEYKIKFENKNSTYQCFQLEDRKTGKLIDLKQHPQYSFSSEKGNFERFVLHIGKNTSDCEKLIAMENAQKYSLTKSEGEYYINYNLGDQSENVEIRIVDLLGREISRESASLQNSGRLKINKSDLEGIYLIQLISDEGSQFAKKAYL